MIVVTKLSLIWSLKALNLITILIEFYSKNCKDECTDCLKNKLLEIQALIEEKYLLNLTYQELKFLYKSMPTKLPFLRRMVEINPLIKKKYYIEYAKHYGFHKNDIKAILMAKYSTWAAAIALYFGWIDEDMRVSIEKRLSNGPICINGKEKKGWKYNRQRRYHFHNKISKDPLKNTEKHGFLLPKTEK